MITERQFNDVLKQINEAFKDVNKKVDKLQEQVNTKEAPSASKKTRPKTS
jgi:uncharacterized protein YoxC